MKTSSISTVIVTRNRQEELKHCLGSLAAQTTKLDELIIVDNNSQDNTKQIVSAFSRNVIFTVRYVKETKIGYPIVYNRGLKEAQYNWVAFIDDDCVAGQYWFESIKKAVKKSEEAVAILGYSHTYFSENIFALATWFIDYFWKKERMKNNRIIDFEILDNKNIIYNKKFLNKKNIRYDEKRVNINNGSSEDCDLGMQIQQAGGKAIYDSNIYVLHKDPTNLKHYFFKLLFSTIGHLSYEEKWESFRKANARKIYANQRSLRFFACFIKLRQYTFYKKILLALTVITTLLLAKAIRVFKKM